MNRVDALAKLEVQVREVLAAAALDGAITRATNRPIPVPGTALGPARPSTPTPANIARTVAGQHPFADPAGRTGREPASTTDDARRAAAAITAAASRTWAAWKMTATDDQQQELVTDRPSIPGDLDRALLVDASDALGAYTLDDRTRVQLRAYFWAAFDGH